jgi:SAM-dependent methyltransferase
MRDFWNQRYSEPDFAYGTEPNAYFKSIIDELPPGKLLVPGAGEGRDAVYAAMLGWDVLAFDLSEAGKKKALQLAKEMDVEIVYHVADAEHFSTMQSFDAIALIFFHLPAQLRQSLHERLAYWLAPGGHLIIEAFTPMQLNNSSGGPKDLSLMLTEDILLDELPYLQMVELSEIQTHLNEGPYHNGLADVVRLHGVKC